MPGLPDYLDALRAHYGRPSPVDADSPFGRLVRAILAQGATPKKLEEALRSLRVYALLDPHKLRELDHDTVALAVQAAGMRHRKAARLKNFVAWFLDRFEGDLDRLREIPAPRLREQLLELEGMTPETADTILLEGLGMPVPVVDLPTYRVMTRHELALEDATYDDLQELVAKGLPKDAETLREFHSLIGVVGREYCRPKARCEKCPLKPLLPGK
ncbi:MAG TPA: endonuclease III domain-containing protein [Planctomycetota bacterium]|nr:endonuclease III domain-containing protein [Planctomycetota bacterium]